MLPTQAVLLLLCCLASPTAQARRALTSLTGPPDTPEPVVEVLSWQPRAFKFSNFLSAAECDYLIKKGQPHLVKSTVVDADTGESVPSEVRTSSGMFLIRGSDDIVRAIEKRIAIFTGIPISHGEGLQILHYEASQEYRPHLDYFQDTHNTENGGQRIATVLMYLSDVEEGGETVFPTSPEKPVQSCACEGLNADSTSFSECARAGVAMKPRKGDALFFFSLQANGVQDTTSMHAGCPVLHGDKWSATKWMRVKPYDAPKF